MCVCVSVGVCVCVCAYVCLCVCVEMSKSPVNKKSKSEFLTTSKCEDIGVLFPRIIVPTSKVDLKKWAVVACDQYTSEDDYWQRVEQFVGDSFSTLRLTFPEIYLEKGKDEEIISGIVSSMQNYDIGDVFEEKSEPGIILVERTLREGTLRRGIVLALDLEEYDYKIGSTSLIRATEKTIESRIPARLAVRRKVSLELPHIIVLIDDPTDSVLSSMWQRHMTDDAPAQYETELMENSGHLRGVYVNDPSSLSLLCDQIRILANPKTFAQKYNLNEGEKDVLLFAMGDGNHSLATAKAHWEEIKQSPNYRDDHPARYALVELQNCQDPTLVFEPINRLVFGTEKTVGNIFTDIKKYFGTDRIVIEEGDEAFEKATLCESNTCKFGYVFQSKKGSIQILNPTKVLHVAEATDFLDHWLPQHESTRIDYVHEMTAIDRFCATDDQFNIGFVFSAMEKSDLFKTVILDGALPRKTFSMGNAHDKRFYFEARRIAPM